MDTVNVVLPIEIFASRKLLQKSIITYSLYLLLFSWCFWQGSGRFFTEKYYNQKIVIIMPVIIIITVAMFFGEIINFNRKKPILTLTREGILIFEKPFEYLGRVNWRDITEFSEIATGETGRKITVYVNNQSMYINKITDPGKRQRSIKASQAHNNGILWIETNRIGFDQELFKKILKEMIAQHGPV